jgi:hypothetical protein
LLSRQVPPPPLIQRPSCAAPITLTLPNSTVTTPYACVVNAPVVIGAGATIIADADVTITGATAICRGCAAGYPLGSSPDTTLSVQYTYQHGFGSK